MFGFFANQVGRLAALAVAVASQVYLAVEHPEEMLRFQNWSRQFDDLIVAELPSEYAVWANMFGLDKIILTACFIAAVLMIYETAKGSIRFARSLPTRKTQE